MEALLDTQHGTSTLLAGIVIVGCLHLLLRIGEFIFSLLRKKSESADKQIEDMARTLAQNTLAVNELTKKSEGADTQIMKTQLAFNQNTDTMRGLEIAVGMLREEIKELAKIKGDVTLSFTAFRHSLPPKKYQTVMRAAKEELGIK